MKRILSLTLSVLSILLILSLTGNGNQAKACDRTDTRLDSVVFSGGLYTIYATVCIGGGVQGINKGAGGDTRTFAFGFYTPGAVPITIVSFTPGLFDLTSDTTGCNMAGFNQGPQPSAPFGTQGTIAYFDYLSCPNAFTCISSTANCGGLHSQCDQYSFTVDVLPDSVRVFGAEGGGNPVAGCYPNPDMLIDFTVLPVEWGELYGKVGDLNIELKWSTLDEVNNDHFEVMRSYNGTHFSNIGMVPSGGAGHGLRSYSFTDHNPIVGKSYYKIVQVDKDALRSESNVIVMSFSQPDGLSWGEIGPVPARDDVNLSFQSGNGQEMTLSLYDVKGSEVMNREVHAQAGMNNLHLDLSDLEAGVYYLRLKGPNGALDYKLAKL